MRTIAIALALAACTPALTELPQIRRCHDTIYMIKLGDGYIRDFEVRGSQTIIELYSPNPYETLAEDLERVVNCPPVSLVEAVR